MIRIGVNLQALRPGEIGGLEGYFRNLLKRITEMDREVVFVLFCADYNQASFAGQSGIETLLLSAAEFAELSAEKLRRFGLDLWFCPLLVLEPEDPGLPSAVTIPDLQHEGFPEFFTAEILAWRRSHYPRSARDADRVLTISEYSRRHIVESLNVEPAKVVAIHLAASAIFSTRRACRNSYLESIRRRHELPDRYFYYPANTWPHKNHHLLFEALAKYRREIGDCPYIILTGAEVGAPGWWSEPVHELGLVDRVRHLGFLPTEDLPGLYANSLALVVPSLFEGFCIPVVEAMSCGCPVLCSTATSLPEVAGDAALFFDPRHPEDLSQQLLAVTGAGGNRDAPGREELISRGHQRARAFNWGQTARETLDVFLSLLEAGSAGEVVLEESELPLITVITPSYQQGEFIERTLRSVLEQGYPRLQYLVMDGGSSDQTVAILEQYRSRYPEILSYVVEPDRGQAHAVNKGLALAEGEIIGWLNSDDTYAPGALLAVATAFAERPECDVIYGRARYISDEDRDLGPYPTRPDYNLTTLANECYICQPTVFWRRSLVDGGLSLDENLQSCMDYDLWIRLGQEARFSFLDRHLASSRLYPSNKTIGQRKRVYDESFSVVKRHYGRLPRSWALGKAFHMVDRGDPIFDTRPLSWRALMVAELMLFRHNWSQAHYRSYLFSRAVTLLRRVKQLRFSLPRSGHSITMPGSWLAFRLEFTVSDQAPSKSSSVGIWLFDQRLARVTVEGPGTYSQVVPLPWQQGDAPYRLRLRCENGLREQMVQVEKPILYTLVADDGWLQRRDTLRLPAEWTAVELAFMLPATENGVAKLKFGLDGEVVDTWLIAAPGEHRRRLSLPSVSASRDGVVELDFQSTTALPPEPERGETRHLAILVREIVPATSSPTAGR